jgi:hypothetical protein
MRDGSAEMSQNRCEMTAQEAIDEIHRVAGRRMELYRTLDRLETELKDGGGLPEAFRGFSDRPQEIARRSRHAELAQEIQALRARLDELRHSVPFERIAEIDHYWNIEHTTSHSLLRDMGTTPP